MNGPFPSQDMWRAALLVLWMLVAGWPGLAATQDRRDPATVRLVSDLKDNPAVRSRVLATLPPGTQVVLLEMHGASARVEFDGLVGWLPASSLHLGDAPSASSSQGAAGTSWIRGLSGMLGGGDRKKNAMVPIGVRGLQREDMANATPDPAAVDAVERFRVQEQQVLAHARSHGLRTRDYAYASSSTGSGGQAGSTGLGGGLGFGQLFGQGSSTPSAPGTRRKGADN